MERLAPVGVLPLKVRLTGSILALLVFMLTLDIVFTIEADRQEYRADLERHVQLLLDALSSAVRGGLSAGDAVGLQETLEGLEIWERHGIAVRVFYENGALAAESLSGGPAIGSAWPAYAKRLLEAGGTVLFDWYHDRLEAGTAVYVDGTPVGACCVGLTLKPFVSRMRKLRTRVVAISILVIAIGIVLSVPISRSVTGPIEEIVQVTRRIAEGDLNLKVPSLRNDEFGTLAHAINMMVGELNRTMERLRESEERYALSVSGANDGIWDWDVRHDRIYLSSRWKRMLGYEDDEIGEAPSEWFDRIHPEDRPRVDELLERHMKARTTHFETEFRILHKNGDYIWVLSRGLAVRNAAGRTYRIAGSQTDMTSRKAAEHQLEHSAYFDSLTELPNRRFLLERMRHLLGEPHGGRGVRFAVLFLDVDRFKFVNDSFGHETGDELLKEIAYRLKHTLRSQDLLVRLGGDEFVVLVQDDVDLHVAVSVADRILELFLEHFELAGFRVFASVSIGIALATGQYLTPEEILRDADIAMYRAKSQGKGRYEVFNTEMRRHVQRSFTFETSLREALGSGMFAQFYQPIVSLSGHLLGFESLIRWNHPEHGLVHPAEFIPLAEELGLMHRIDMWCIEEAVRTLSEWDAGFRLEEDFLLSVNLSSRNFASGADVPDHIRKLIQQYGIVPRRLALEVTENNLIPAFDAASYTLREIRRLGCSIMIDDFGTGYSSLSYLHRLPFDYLKIDGSFIKSVTVDSYSNKIVKSMLHLAQELELEVIAEGVDSFVKLEHLRGLSCRYIQGYLVSEPLPREEAVRYLERYLMTGSVPIERLGQEYR
jgi:diguanylate cyclase (GGDEF)-like protein/PAS domain S-box-containing protein